VAYASSPIRRNGARYERFGTLGCYGAGAWGSRRFDPWCRRCPTSFGEVSSGRSAPAAGRPSEAGAGEAYLRLWLSRLSLFREAGSCSGADAPLHVSRIVLEVLRPRVAAWLGRGCRGTRDRAPCDGLRGSGGGLSALSQGFPLGHAPVTASARAAVEGSWACIETPAAFLTRPHGEGRTAPRRSSNLFRSPVPVVCCVCDGCSLGSLASGRRGTPGCGRRATTGDCLYVDHDGETDD
jgi:hypothetical protein